jgi:lipoprotein signal peptidase
VLSLIAMVVVLDQAAKWWAWRHVPWTKINSGGDVLVGARVGAWYARPVTGALLDLLDVGLLTVAVGALARRPVPAAVSVPGALMIAGWGSNLLDRLGIHYWTAPGSVRGVVDFIHIGDHFYNLADFFIIGCTPLFLLAAGYYGVRAARRPSAARSLPPPARSWARVRARARVSALAGAGLVLVVALGAANYGGASATTQASGQQRSGPSSPVRLPGRVRCRRRRGGRRRSVRRAGGIVHPDEVERPLGVLLLDGRHQLRVQPVAVAQVLRQRRLVDGLHR